MPLIKRTAPEADDAAKKLAADVTAPEADDATKNLAADVTAPVQGAPNKAEVKPAYTGRKAATDAPMTKDDYWRRREDRDIEKDKRIGRAGLYQAALQSVGVLQYSPDVRSLADYLKAVRLAAEDGLKFVNGEESK